jgi:outer membrane protein assembly factor BamA
MTANRLRILSTICVSILVVNAIFAQTGRKISGIQTEGLQTLTTETVIATSGLKIGETFSQKDEVYSLALLSCAGGTSTVGSSQVLDSLNNLHHC